MIRIVVSFVFALCLTIASTAHLSAASFFMFDAIGNEVVDELGSVSACGQQQSFAVVSGMVQECAMSGNSSGATHQRCQIDVGPVVTCVNFAGTNSIVIRSTGLSVSHKKRVLEPALRPPQII